VCAFCVVAVNDRSAAHTAEVTAAVSFVVAQEREGEGDRKPAETADKAKGR
jgi:hypothetical protein